MMLLNFNLTKESIVSKTFLEAGYTTFYAAIKAVQSLPYGRMEDPTNLASILRDGKATCSTKHAALKTICEENNIHGLHLMMCIYPMHENNTSGVGTVLKKYNLPYIIEAHTYLSYNEERYDYTFAKKSRMRWVDEILIETEIDTDQITHYKNSYHKEVLADWIKRDKIPYTLEEIWSIREECITAISNHELENVN